MALVAYSEWPAFDALQELGMAVVAAGDASSSSLPEITVGLMNLMPDAALRATDRQFVKLVAACQDRANLWIFPFTAAVEHRDPDTRRYIEDYYLDVETIRDSGLDALIITGANPAQHLLSREVFWGELTDVVRWARDEVDSVLCSCLATHAVLEIEHGLRRSRLAEKRWGVYEHRILESHWLVEGLSDPVVAPHSHWYDLNRAEFESTGARVLVESEEAGVHMAVSEDDFYVFFQGHPEYDPVSLLKEYSREVSRYHAGERVDYPPYPENYLHMDSRLVLDDHRRLVDAATTTGADLPVLPEVATTSASQQWQSAGDVIYRNWLGRVIDDQTRARGIRSQTR